MRQVGAVLSLAGAFALFGLSSGPPCEDMEAQGHYDIRCYGAAADDGQDDYPAIRDALAAAGKGGTVVFPAGIWHTSSPIDVAERTVTGPLSQSYYGTSSTRDVAVLRPMEGLPAPLTWVFFSLSNPFRISHLAVDANHAAEVGIYAYKAHSDQLLDHVNVSRALVSGIHLEDTWISSLTHVGAHRNDGHGIVLDSCNAMSLAAFGVSENGGFGLVIQRSFGSSGGLHVERGQVEANMAGGVLVQGTRTVVTLSGLWVEANQGDGVLLQDAWHVKLEGSRISGNAGDCILPRGTRVVGFSPYVTLQGNQYLCPDSGADPYDFAEIEQDPWGRHDLAGGGLP